MWDTKRDEAAPTAKRRKLNADSDVGAKPSTSGAGTSLKTLPPVEVGSVPRDSDISIDIERENTESSLLQYLAELVRLFMYLEEKDKFFDTHRRLFAKRLMSHHDEHLETSFISMIKEQMGQFYTQRLSGMLQDKLASNTMQKAFQKYLVERRVECRKRKEEVLVPFTDGILDEDTIPPADSILERGGLEGMADRLLGTSLARATLPTHSSADTGAIVPSDANPAIGFSMLLNVANSHTEKGRAEQRERNVKSIDENILKFEEALGIDFNAHVLNALHWPSVEVAKLRLPPLLLACQELFSDFYMRDKETRKLSWIHALSVVNLVGTFSGMGYTFVVSTFQACILLLFNDSDRIRVVDARKMLNLSLEQLCHHIKPLLVSRKCRVLRLERRPANETTETFATVNRPNEKSKMNSTNIYPIPNSGRLSFAPQVMQCQAVSDDSGRPATDVLAPKSSEANTYHEGGPERTADGDRAQSTEARSIAIGPDANQGDGNESESFVNTTHPAPPGATAPAQVQQAKEGTASASEINTGSVEPRGESAKEGESDSPKNTQTERSQADARFMQEGDILHINLGFKSRLHRVVVPASIPKVASANTTTSKKHVVVDRSTRVDAVLVKIMKTKKELTHAALNNLVVEALAPTFLPDPRLIKKRLERLIEQEYVERDKDDPRLYRYAS
ncbi:unnamed protein product [Chondrus crispus]|uniref:Cullin family profile domain-containing protein n=1 Tax=Chondrus crispus TaxID=2769 RepID=R7Q374_CHOCR|nr:unnamed protein product [Chondrus crispus]CDF32977.1 unnamed protein product [Chondrus crispus]|eukprot:XP_005712780.1 unnamed protein product [Chondrus crispus]